MTRTKAWRLSLAIILMFGWVFLTPAYSDDPLSLAAQEIEDLRSNVKDLAYQDDFIHLIEQAEEQYDEAVDLKQQKDNAFSAYDDAVEIEALALSTKTSAQSAVDEQTIVVANALTNKNNAQDDLDVATINLATANSNLQSSQSIVNSAGGAGLQLTVYSLLRDGNTAVPGSVICTGTWNSNSMYLPVCGRYDNIIVKLSGQITVPSHWTGVYFAGYTDDGFKMYVDGNLAVSNWREQGTTWSAYSPIYDVSEDKTLDVEIWWYNGGGPGSYFLGWSIPGGWTGAGCDYTGGWGVGFSCDLNTFSSGSAPTQQQLNNLSDAQSEQAAAQQAYNNKLEIRNDKLSVYNQEVQVLTSANQNLTNAIQNLTSAEQNLTNALSEKDNAINNYNQAINDVNSAINDAWRYYDEQSQRELNAAIAQAAANAAANQPTPEPTPEAPPTPVASPDPTPEAPPTPEPTPEAPPTPKPSPDPTPEEPPAPEPTPQPSPDPTPEEPPAPEPTVEPAPEEEPVDNPEVVDQVLEELIPEKGTGTSEDLSGVIANLTSKDNKLVVLSAEQIAAVSQTLNSLTNEAKAEVAESLGIDAKEVAVIAEAMKSNPSLATAFVEFESRLSEAGNTNMPYTLADATTEVQTEAFLSDPLGALTNIDFATVLNPSEWGKDMTDDQREKAQEVVIPVIIASNIVAAAMTRRI